jgi:hypothetical protein
MPIPDVSFIRDFVFLNGVKSNTISLRLTTGIVDCPKDMAHN